MKSSSPRAKSESSSAPAGAAREKRRKALHLTHTRKRCSVFIRLSREGRCTCMFIIIPIIIVGTGLGVFTFFLLKAILLPRRISSIAHLISQERYNQAIKMAKAIAERDPRNSEAHYLLGLAYLKTGRPELALMELKMVGRIGVFTEYCPEIQYRETIAELYKSFNQPEEALKEYLLLLKRYPEMPDYYYKCGQLFEMRNQSDRAFIYYRKAIELNPRYADAHFRLGALLYRMHKYPEARSELETALRYDPDILPAYYYLGKIYREAKEYHAALLSFEKSVRHPDYKLRSLIERGTCYLNMGDYESAIMELERAVKLSPEATNPEMLYARYFLSIAYEKRRRIEDALEQWEFIYRINPSFQDVGEKLAQYQDVHHDDRIKDFLTCNENLFLEICKSIIQAMNLAVTTIKPIPNGAEIIAVDVETKWRNTRKLPRLVRIYRTTEMIDEATVRATHEAMREQNLVRGVIVASAPFSKLAREYAETRPIDLYDKNVLQKLLQRIDMDSGVLKV
ncbi:TPR domain protein [Spirochaeta thermophila DSM 6192]|uniref:TPR domain protein n=2 Tax=Winmispira thermophila TaxID=154 RepID=E0RR41_WINT6|nr:TPR domain protein [Spirochaeta thermophila DSM 6192]